MVFNATFNNISVILWPSVLFVEGTAVSKENHRPVTSHCRGRHGRDHGVQSVPITTKVVSSNPVHGEVYSIQHYMIKFVSDLGQVGGFLRVLMFPPPIRLTGTI
jgi:hypothetical protein